jgi:N-acetylneuraminic acid mutarotase
LIVGGHGTSGDLASTELFDPTKGIFSPSTDLHFGRINHTATLLANGLVLVVGGQYNGNTLDSAELYNPATNTWTNTGSLHLARSYHTATLLSNGQVLVVGGSHWASPPLFSQGTPPGSALDVAELYDPTSGKWTVTDSLHTARYCHTATLLANGEVLVTGGIGGKKTGSAPSNFEDANLRGFPGLNRASDIEASAELYDPKTKSWTVTGSLPVALWSHSATLLPNDQVLVAGGKPSFQSDTADSSLYNLSTGTWKSGGTFRTERNAHTATLLPTGSVLVAGGANESGVLADVELYRATTGTWDPTASLNTARTLHTATLLPDGKVLVTGGGNGNGSPNGVLASAELYSPASESISEPTPTEATPSPITTLETSTPPLLRLAASMIVITTCVVILTACVVILLAAWLVYVLVRRWRK